jgi:hypothetical protein
MGTKTNWPTDYRSQWNLKLNLRHCTANCRPILSSERAPYVKNKESNCHSNKSNIWSRAPKRVRHQGELANWPPVIMWLRPLAIFQGTHRSENCIRLSICHTFTIILQNYAGNKHKFYKIMNIKMSALYGKAKPSTENMRGLNFAAVNRTTVQVSRLLL